MAWYSIKESRERILALFTIVTLATSVVSYFLYHGRDPARCGTLLNDGFWLNPAELSNWQPAGCMMHTYKADELNQCLAGRRLVFIGGINTHALYQGVAAKLDPSFTPSRAQERNEAMTAGDNVRAEYVWDPELDSKEMKSIIKGFAADISRPTLTVLGLSYEQIRKHKDLTNWAAHIGGVLAQLRIDTEERNRQSDHIVVVPMFSPNVSRLAPADQGLITPERVDAINDALASLAARYSIDVAFSFNKVLSAEAALLDGLNPTARANAVLADILLNLRCNIEQPRHYPYASTCCNEYPRPSWVQLAGFVFVAVFIPIAWFSSRRGNSPKTSALLKLAPPARYHVPILVMGGAVILCYFFDRTNIFGKEQKQTSPWQFFTAGGLIIVGSLFTLKTSDKDLAFLNRDQTDEWKGWMQIAILIYHYLGVSRTPYIYQYIRVAPTSYLFMTGFGHAVYFLKKDDYSLKRFVATMLRLNLLNVILAYAMGNDWLLYYFAPLVTWNFFVIYGLMWVGHRHNKNTAFLFAKMVIAATANTLFYRIPGVLEFCWSVLQLLFRMEGDMREWRFRVTLDQYSVFPGMVAAILFVNWSSYSIPKSPAWPTVQKLLGALSAATVIAYAFFEASQESKIVYNLKHPYVGWIPCCAFVVVRNATPWLRRTHNGFFAWVGRGSLETFLLQFHMWLAADTAGLLFVGPANQRLLNAALTTGFFLWIANHVTTATGPLIEWIMGAEPKKQLPTTQAIPLQANGRGVDESRQALLSDQEGSGVGSAVPVNGQPTNVTVQDGEKLEQDIDQVAAAPADGSRVKRAFATAGKDLRVRVLLILAGMAFMNWTYYII